MVHEWLLSCLTNMDGWDWALILMGLLIVWSFYRAHVNQSMKNFNAFDIVMHNGRVDKKACVFVGAFIISSAAFWKHTSKNGLDVGLLTAYGGLFVLPIIGVLNKGDGNDQRGNTEGNPGTSPGIPSVP